MSESGKNDSDEAGEKLIAEFQRKVELAEKNEDTLTSPYHKLVLAAERHKDQRVTSEFDIVYRQGYNELSDYLEGSISDFQTNDKLKKLIPTIKRVLGNYRGAIICYLNGLDQVAFDIMRDVMEITYLFRDFVMHPDNIERWTDGSERVRRNEFSSGKLRKRFAELHGKGPKDLLDTQEYNTHSGMLHVNPGEDLLLDRGICINRNPIFSGRYALADIMHHAKDISFIIHELISTVGVTPHTDPRKLEFLPWAHSLSRVKFTEIMEVVKETIEQSDEGLCSHS